MYKLGWDHTQLTRELPRNTPPHLAFAEGGQCGLVSWTKTVHLNQEIFGVLGGFCELAIDMEIGSHFASTLGGPILRLY